MNYRMLGYLLGLLLLLEGALLSLPMLVSIVYHESPLSFLYTMGIVLLVGVALVLQKPKDHRIYAKDGFVMVAGGWILLSLFGALPFVLSGAIPSYVDALFETVSGFTTTGSSILTAIEGLPKGILFWRSFTHWVGGMGVLVLVLALFPNDNRRSMVLLRAEVPGPQKGKLVPKARQTALILYGIYVALTVVEMLALLLCGMPFYDAAVNALATAGTGGFSVLNASIGGYQNPAAEWVIATFMLFFGINFSLYFFILIGRFRDFFESEELRVYLLLVFGATVLITVNTLSLSESFSECVRAAFFQVTSISSTTGFATLDYDALWPALSKAILVLLTVVGAMAGSTSGGMKISRVIILFKSAIREIRHVLRPRSVNLTRLDGEVLREETVRATSGYLTVYLLLLVFGTVLLSLDPFGSLEVSFTAALTSLSNVGPGLGAIGPAGNFAGFSVLSKLLLSFLMLVGRLEIFPMLILFSPTTWKRR